jgi:hypothetical protein
VGLCAFAKAQFRSFLARLSWKPKRGKTPRGHQDTNATVSICVRLDAASCGEVNDLIVRGEAPPGVPTLRIVIWPETRTSSPSGSSSRLGGRSIGCGDGRAYGIRKLAQFSGEYGRLFEALPARDPAACREEAAARMARDEAWRKARAGELARAIGPRN